jgi:hypothetical protein
MNKIIKKILGGNTMKITTYKQKLQEDLKTVLMYQMVTNTSLRDIHPSHSIDDLKASINKKLNPPKTYRKLMRYEVNVPPVNKEELYELIPVLKYFNQDKTEFKLYDDETDKRLIELNKEELITNLLQLIDPMTDITIRMLKYYCNNEYRYSFKVNINLMPRYNKSRQLSYLKYNYKLVKDYQMITGTPVSNLVNFKYDTKAMRLQMNNNTGSFKEFNFNSLYKMNTERMDNLTVYLTVEKFDGHDDEYKFSNINDAIEFINKEKLCSHDLKDLSYHKIYNNHGYYERHILISFDAVEMTDDDKIFIKDFDTLDSFKDYTFTHGLFAYNYHTSIEDKVICLIENKDIEICCAWTNEYIGPYGVFVKGDCKLASLFDLGSLYDKKSNSGRFIYSKRLDYDWLINDPKQIVGSNHTNGEAIVTNIQITGIWAKKNFVDKNNDIEKIKEITGIKEVTLV